LTFSPTLGGILILAGAWRGHLQNRPSLWLWTEGRKPEQLRAPVLDDLRPEGIAEVQHDGRRGLLVVSDDGNQDELYLRGRSLTDTGESSRYVVIPFADLRRDNPELAK